MNGANEYDEIESGDQSTQGRRGGGAGRKLAN